jgi:isochorismate synthase
VPILEEISVAIPSVDFDHGALNAMARGFVAATLAELAGQPLMAVVTVPAPRAPLSAFLGVMPRHMSFVWNQPPSGIDCAGGGVAHEIRVSGRDRLEQLREQSESLWARVHVARHPAVTVDYFPRLFGGLAFAADNSTQSPWLDFGDGAFSLARWTYGRSRVGGFLSVALNCESQASPRDRARVLDELDRILRVLTATAGAPDPVPAVPAGDAATSIRQLPEAAWEAYIGQIHGAIASDGYLKIVAARRCDVTLASPADDLDVLGRLMTEPKCAHFAFRRAASSFVGASPELLFLKSGLELRTQALAGTARSTGPMASTQRTTSARLLGSTKDRSEHDFVVTAIRDALAPLCTEVTVSTGPEVLKLRNIIHINTPFEAKVLPTTHVSELLHALHPTPAVGGVPGHAAREWIVSNEHQERGWYTGPVGWFDCRGDGEFAVAIRCGVVAGTHAHLYTGAGVVLGSDHSAEYAETSLKQLPMLRALGVEPR